MASATEQLATQFNWSAFGKAKDLKSRLLFTLGAMIVFRLGTHIPLPGIDATILADVFAQKSGSLLGIFDMFAGGALQRMAIFALSIAPYISASIFVMLASYTLPNFIQLRKEGEVGRKKMAQYTRYGTVCLAIIQGYVMALGLESMSGPKGSPVIDPGIFFRTTVVVTLLGGTMFLIWLCEQITARGIGNGSSIIIYAGILARMPSAVAKLFELGREGALSSLLIIVVMVLAVATIMFIVFMERAQRRIIVQYPKRQVGMKVFAGESSHLPLKLNSSGVFSIMFASMLLALPMTLVGFSGQAGTGFVGDLIRILQHGQPLYMLIYATLIVFFAFFFTSVMSNPQETAENLRKQHGFVPGLRPGLATENHIRQVLNRITVVGSAYLIVVALLPEMLIAHYSIPFYFGGTGLLIVVTVTLDTVAQVHSHLVAHQYEGLLRKSRLKGSKKK